MDQIMEKTSDIQTDQLEDSLLTIELEESQPLRSTPKKAKTLRQISLPYSFSWAEVQALIP